MINQSDLQTLLGDLESDRVERTESTKDTDEFAEVVTAFANDWRGHRLPGYLLIGVKNDGRLSGLKVTDTVRWQHPALAGNFGSYVCLPGRRHCRRRSPALGLATGPVQRDLARKRVHTRGAFFRPISSD